MIQGLGGIEGRTGKNRGQEVTSRSTQDDESGGGGRLLQKLQESVLSFGIQFLGIFEKVDLFLCYVGTDIGIGAEPFDLLHRNNLFSILLGNDHIGVHSLFDQTTGVASTAGGLVTFAKKGSSQMAG